jgi:nucleoside-diphosphate-sugar epimerase
MRYFVTGATGFLGGFLARELRAAGHAVSALVRDPGRAGDLSQLGVELHRGDITDRASLDAPMAGVDGVFHLAAWYKVGVKDTRQAEAVNVGGTRNVLEAMRDAKVPKGVYTSTLAVFGDTGGRLVDESYRHDGPWLSVYDRTKWQAHYEVALPMIERGLPLVIVQPGVVYGPGDLGPFHDVWVQYLTRKLPMVPKGTTFCWSHVEDVAHGHVLAMERGKPGASYILAGPCHTLAEVLALAERITGIPAPRLRASPGLLKAMAAVMQVVGAVVPLPATLTAESIRVSAGTTYIGTNEKAKRELGYAPRPLAEGLEETLRWQREQLGKGGRAQGA